MYHSCIILGIITQPGRIAQLVRASLLHREGQGFESLCAHSRPGRNEKLPGLFCAPTWAYCSVGCEAYHPRRGPIRVERLYYTEIPFRENQVRGSESLREAYHPRRSPLGLRPPWTWQE